MPVGNTRPETTGTGETHHHHAALHGDDDTATRTYRHGDDLRRVHWKSTARTGQLMVRREEQPHHRHAGEVAIRIAYPDQLRSGIDR